MFLFFDKNQKFFVQLRNNGEKYLNKYGTRYLPSPMALIPQMRNGVQAVPNVSPDTTQQLKPINRSSLIFSHS